MPIRQMYFSVRNHWKLYITIVILATGLVFMFNKFYALQLPYTLRGLVIDQYAASNELASCRQDLRAAITGKQAAIEAANPDLFQ